MYAAQVPYQVKRFTDLTNAFQNVSTKPAKLYGWRVYNPHSARVFVKFSDTSAGAVGTAATKTVVPCPSPTAAADPAFVSEELRSPIAFNTLIRVCSVTGLADNDNTAPGTATYIEIFYKE